MEQIQHSHIIELLEKIGKIGKNDCINFLELIFTSNISESEDFLTLFNFSVYSLFISGMQKISFKDTYDIFRIFIYFNSNYSIKDASSISMFYYRTISHMLAYMNTFLNDSAQFIKSEENVFTCEELLLYFAPFISWLKYTPESLQLIEAQQCMEEIKTFLGRLDNATKQLAKVKLNVLFKKNNTINMNQISVSLFHSSLEKSDIATNSSQMKMIYPSEPTKPNTTTRSEYQKVANDTIKLHSYLESHTLISETSSSGTNEIETKASQGRFKNPPSLTNVTKKYNSNHFDRVSFYEKFLKSRGYNNKIIYESLEQTTVNLLSTVEEENRSVMDYLNYQQLYEIFKKYFPEHSLSLIGSGRSGILNMKKNDIVDLLILKDEKKESGSSEFAFKNLKNVMKRLQLMTQNEKVKFNGIDRVTENDLLQFRLGLVYVNTTYKPTGKSKITHLNVRLNLYDKRLKLASRSQSDVFWKNAKVKVLHYYFQEILIYQAKLLQSKFELSVLIISFLDHYYQLLERNNKKSLISENASQLDFLQRCGEDSDSIIEKEIVVLFDTYYYYSINEMILKKIHIEVSYGELIFEFLRYFLNYMQYLKNEYSKIINRNFQPCKGYEQLQEIFEYDEYKDRNYVLNHLFWSRNTPEYLHKYDFDNDFCKRVEQVENLYFKICENPDKVKSYEQICESISFLDDMK